eukprot:1939345-Prymnesium_polylepis.1
MFVAWGRRPEAESEECFEVPAPAREAVKPQSVNHSHLPGMFTNQRDTRREPDPPTTGKGGSRARGRRHGRTLCGLSLIHISEPTRRS